MIGRTVLTLEVRNGADGQSSTLKVYTTQHTSVSLALPVCVSPQSMFRDEFGNALVFNYI